MKTNLLVIKVSYVIIKVSNYVTVMNESCILKIKAIKVNIALNNADL